MPLTREEPKSRPGKVGTAVAPGSGARKDSGSWTESGPAARAEGEARAASGEAAAGKDPRVVGVKRKRNHLVSTR